MSKPIRPRVFLLHRDHDIDGLHGTGRVAEGCVWTDGTVSLHWFGAKPSWQQFRVLADAVATQGPTNTRIEWLD